MLFGCRSASSSARHQSARELDNWEFAFISDVTPSDTTSTFACLPRSSSSSTSVCCSDSSSMRGGISKESRIAEWGSAFIILVTCGASAAAPAVRALPPRGRLEYIFPSVFTSESGLCGGSVCARGVLKSQRRWVSARGQWRRTSCAGRRSTSAGATSPHGGACHSGQITTAVAACLLCRSLMRGGAMTAGGGVA